MFLDYFVLFGVSAGLIISIWVLISPFFNTEANQFFAYTTLTLSTITFFGWLEADNAFWQFLAQITWEFLFPATLFYYFIKSLKIQFSEFRPSILFLPFVCSTLIHLALDLDFKFGVYRLPFRENDLLIEGYETVEYNLAFLFNVVMVVWSFVLISMDKQNSDIKKRWLSRLCLFIVLLLIAWLTLEYIELLLGLDFWMFLWVGLSAFFLWIGYYGMYKLRLQEQKEEIHELVVRSTSRKSRNPKPENDHIQKFESLMLEDELYKDPNLGRDQVAEKLGLSSGYFSQLINNNFESSFVDLVNQYRVDAAKMMLSDNLFHKYSILAIGMEAGFKSKSAFYSTFQKFTQLTPGAYKEASLKS